MLEAGPGARGPSKEVELTLARESFEYALRHYLPVDFVRPIINSRRARIAIEHFQRRIFGIAERAVDLDRPVNHIMQHARAEKT